MQWSWISDPLEWGPFECAESLKPSAMMQWLKVMLWEVAAGPSSRGPEADKFSSTAQLIEQWS
ncbi:MAG: hypothetical protein ACYS6W_05915, partial [Planctomycetota bacterium]